MATTTNFGWETPDDTDLVKDGALAMRTLGNSIDTSFVDLKGGTTGQILSKASNTDLDYAWITNDVGDITAVTAGTGISGGGTSGAVTITNSMATAIDAKGDLIIGTGADAFDRLALGTNGYVLTADSSTTTGTKWAAIAGGLSFITRNSFSNVAGVNIDSIFSSSYFNYLVIIEKISAATPNDDIQLQMRYSSSTTATNYQGANATFPYTGTFTPTTIQSGTTTAFTLASGGDSTYPLTAALTFSKVGNTTEVPMWHGTAYMGNAAETMVIGGQTTIQQTYTGIRLQSTSSNITGVVSVYGYAKA